jgi:anti-sigma factor RsiW
MVRVQDKIGSVPRASKRRRPDVLACRDVSELVTDYLERRLPFTGWIGVRWHLLQCHACRRYVVQMRQTIRLLAESAFPPPGADIEDTVLRSVRAGAQADPASGD